MEMSLIFSLIFLLATPSGALQKRAEESQAAAFNESSTLASGSTAVLSEEGYQRVAALKSNKEMELFIRRVLAAEARQVKDESGMSGVAPFYSGVKGKKTLLALKQEIGSATWVEGGLGRTLALSKENYARVAALHDAAHMNAFARRVKETDGHSLRLDVWQRDPSPGNTEPLNEKGYQAVAALKSDKEMKLYITRLLLNEARLVKDEAGLNGFVPYYSGVVSVQDIDSLKKELRSKSQSAWVGGDVGQTSPLTEDGYQLVAATQSDMQMKAYFRRLLKLEGLKITDEGGLNGIVPFYNGKTSTQSLEQAKHELRSVPWAAPAEV